MSELASVLENGTVEEVRIIAERLPSLPKFDCHVALASLLTKIGDVERLEAAVSSARRQMRGAAERLRSQIEANWTPEEIGAATGYGAVEKGKNA